MIDGESLWSRAESFDWCKWANLCRLGAVSIPLEQGEVFRQHLSPKWKSIMVSIPLAQGGVFRRGHRDLSPDVNGFQSLWSRAGSFDFDCPIRCVLTICFNPFGAGQGLSTLTKDKKWKCIFCLNPFSSGQVFRKIFQSSYFWYWLILIPLEQGGVFRR